MRPVKFIPSVKATQKSWQTFKHSIFTAWLATVSFSCFFFSFFFFFTSLDCLSVARDYTLPRFSKIEVGLNRNERGERIAENPVTLFDPIYIPRSFLFHSHKICNWFRRYVKAKNTTLGRQFSVHQNEPISFNNSRVAVDYRKDRYVRFLIIATFGISSLPTFGII